MVLRGRTVVLLMIGALLLGLFVAQFANAWQADEPSGHQKQNQVVIENKTPQIWEQSGLSEEHLNKIASTYYLIHEKYYQSTDSQQLVDGAIRGMLSTLNDPYTVYMDQEQAQQFTETVIDSSFTGIGAEVTLKDGRVTVVSPIKGSPAEKAGLLAMDQIISVNGEPLEGLGLNESVMKIRGPKGTQAKLEVLRAGAVETVEIIVVRDEIDLETVKSELLEDEWGYIEIFRFSQDTAQRFHEELNMLEAKGMKGLIIDVRNNPGGILHVVVELLEPFIPSGRTIVQVEHRDGSRELTTSRTGKGKDYPIAVLTNVGSASASEILAAALQEAAGHAVIGEATFGKGTVQATFDTGINDGSNVKITTSKWLTPNGKFVHETGVQPNIVVELPEYFRTMPLPRDQVLAFDAVGAEVVNLQLILEGLGYELRTDGYFDELTKQAVQNFQAEHEIPVTGEVDESTASKLEAEIISVILDPQNDLQLRAAKEHLQAVIKP